MTSATHDVRFFPLPFPLCPLEPPLFCPLRLSRLFRPRGRIDASI